MRDVRVCERACARARVYIDAPVLHAVRVPADRLTTVVVRDSASAALTEVRCETVVNCAGARGRLSGRLQAKLTRQKTGGATCADGVGTPGRLLAPVSTHSILEDLTYQLNSPSASAGNSARVPSSTVRCSRHCSVPQRRSERRAPVNTEAALLCGFRTHGPLGR